MVFVDWELPEYRRLSEVSKCEKYWLTFRTITEVPNFVFQKCHFFVMRTFRELWKHSVLSCTFHSNCSNFFPQISFHFVWFCIDVLNHLKLFVLLSFLSLQKQDLKSNCIIFYCLLTKFRYLNNFELSRFFIKCIYPYGSRYQLNLLIRYAKSLTQNMITVNH